MSKVLEAAKAHFKDVLSQGLKGPIIVKEWGDQEVYYKPATNFFQESKIVELQSQGKTVDALIMSLILRALDKEGKPLFTQGDRQELMREVDPNVILRIVTEMNDPADNEKVEQALGN
jgi:hypothetical protein